MLSSGVARCNVVWRTSALSAWWRCIAAARPPPRSRQLRYFGYSSRAPTLAADPPARRQSCEGRQQLHRRPTAQHGRVSCLGLRTRMLQTREARMRLSKACWWEVSSCFLRPATSTSIAADRRNLCLRRNNTRMASSEDLASYCGQSLLAKGQGRDRPHLRVKLADDLRSQMSSSHNPNMGYTHTHIPTLRDPHRPFSPSYWCTTPVARSCFWHSK